jgi:hypothetical protein
MGLLNKKFRVVPYSLNTWAIETSRLGIIWVYYTEDIIDGGPPQSFIVEFDSSEAACSHIVKTLQAEYKRNKQREERDRAIKRRREMFPPRRII